MNIHELIDRFVKVVDPSATLFRPIESAPWIDALEQRIPRRLPVSYRSLVTRYAFSSFDTGGIHFFANTGAQSPDELPVAIFTDRNIANVTLAANFIQFARPEDGSYDPICFDARRNVNNREYAIVRLDHEEILCRNRAGSPVKIADSFYRFILSQVSNSET